MRNAARLTIIVAAIAVLIGIGSFHVCHATDDYVPGDLVVVFAADDTPMIDVGEEGLTTLYPALDNVLATYDVVDAKPLFVSLSPLQNVYLLHFGAEANLDSISTALSELPYVKSVERNWILTTNTTPNDYYFSHDENGSGQLDEWTWYKMQVNRAWKITKGSPSTVIGIVDTGFDYLHADLDDGVTWINSAEDINHNGKFDNVSSGSGGDLDGIDNDGNGKTDDVIGYDFLGNDPDPYPTSTDHGNHGTFMGSIACAETNNSFGVAGINWHSKLMILKAGSGSGVSLSAAIDGINYAAANGVDVINMSFSSSFGYTPLHDAIHDADSLGVIFVGSAADNNNETPMYPGSWSEVIRVAAVDSLGYKTTGSSYGTDVDISAPTSQTSDNEGGVMVCTWDGTGSNYYTGDSTPHLFRFTQLATSGAAAEVTGVIGLIKSEYPDSSAAFIKKELFRGARSMPDSRFGLGKLGAGMLDAYRSLTQWGTVAADTSWGSATVADTVYVSGDVVVANGVTLTIEPGTTVLVAKNDNEHAGFDTDHVEFNVEGELVADGTAVKPIKFQSWNPTSNQDWVGFYFDSTSAGGTFDHCKIERAASAIETYVPVEVTNSTIDTCLAGLLVRRGNALLQNSTVQDIGDRAVVVEDDVTTLRNAVINRVDATGLDVAYPGSVVLRNSILVLCDEGMHIEDTALTTAADIDSSCTFGSNDIGIHAYNTGTHLTVKQAFFDSNVTAGMYLDSTSSPVVDGNGFDANDVAIYCNASSSPTITNNVIEHFTDGIVAASSSNPDIGHYSTTGNNQIAYANLGGKYVHNYTGGSIYAQNNCWNVATGGCAPSSSRFSGTVDRSSPICCTFSEYMVYRIPGPPPTPKNVPKATQLTSIVPNPFNPITSVHFDVASQSKVEMKVYDVTGRLVRVLMDETKPAGSYQVVWDGRDTRGARTASGVYFVRLVAGHQVFTKKMVMLK